MFDRFVRLSQARKAHKSGHLEQALKLLADPILENRRVAEELRESVLASLLQRAERRLEDGALPAAREDVRFLRRERMESSRLLDLEQEVDRAIQQRGGRDQEARRMLHTARAKAARGELAAAREVFAAVQDLEALPEEREGLAQALEGQARGAKRACEDAESALAAGEVALARDALRRAVALDAGIGGREQLAKRIAEASAAAVQRALEQRAATGDLIGALTLAHGEQMALPELGENRKFTAAREKIEVELTSRLRSAISGGKLEEALSDFQELDPRVRESAGMAETGQDFEDLARALDLEGRGGFAAARDIYDRLGPRWGSGLKERARQARRLDAQSGKSLAQVRKHAQEGRIQEAREELIRLLELCPMHEVARREMETLDRGSRERVERMEEARTLARDGKLAEASAQALSLAVPGEGGEEARLLLKELQARIDLVESGLQQILRSVHGRDTRGIEGLRHCLSRLEELRRVQSDHEELERLFGCLQSEIEGLEALARAEDHLSAGAVRALGEELAAFESRRPQLLQEDRLDARLLEFVDGVLLAADHCVSAGHLRRARGWCGALEVHGERFPVVGERIQGLRKRIEEQEEVAASAVASARGALEARDLEGVERALAEARGAWGDSPDVLQLEADLGKLRRQSRQVEDVELLAKRQDYGAARQRLGELGPTEDLMKTRIFDLKKNLAKAQGLDHGFLLRVDEGGEFIVFRDDSLTIGNVRDGSADLPVLANIAGRHARIQRSMSFHGGMQDKILAEQGPLAIQGRNQKEHKLSSGDLVGLGQALELLYEQPSKRSLTASVTIKGGFQVCGTDRILLMKDRGRDGRILIGSGKDAHVRVSGASTEVELFANRDGQIRVRAEGGGVMDGRPFTGEHPVTPGELVTCGGVSFILQPWSRCDALG